MSKTAYTESYALSETMRELPRGKLVTLESIYKAAYELVREYEHGTADIEDVGVDNIRQYRNVISDYLLYLTISLEHKGEFYETNHSRCNG